MPDAIEVMPGIVVPADAQEVRAARSSGPGGQNVNKVASKIDLRVDPARIQGLADDARVRLLRLCHNRMDSDGRLVVTSQRTRDQRRNLVDAQEKLRDWIRRALEPAKPRVATRPTKPSRE